jgi:hypothetical protein
MKKHLKKSMQVNILYSEHGGSCSLRIAGTYLRNYKYMCYISEDRNSHAHLCENFNSLKQCTP